MSGGKILNDLVAIGFFNYDKWNAGWILVNGGQFNL
jgi:hypothetical protein